MNTSCPDRLRKQPPSLDGLQSLGKLAGLAGRALSVHLRETCESGAVKRQQCFLPKVSVSKQTKFFSPSEGEKVAFYHPLFFTNIPLFNLKTNLILFYPRKKAEPSSLAQRSASTRPSFAPLQAQAHSYPNTGLCLRISQGSHWLALPISFFSIYLGNNISWQHINALFNAQKKIQTSAQTRSQQPEHWERYLLCT